MQNPVRRYEEEEEEGKENSVFCLLGGESDRRKKCSVILVSKSQCLRSLWKARYATTYTNTTWRRMRSKCAPVAVMLPYTYGVLELCVQSQSAEDSSESASTSPE
jgi:hypothetical protein